MNIVDTEEGRLLTIARLSSDQAVSQLTYLIDGYHDVNQLSLHRITMTSSVYKALARVLLESQENKWKSLKFVDCPLQAVRGASDASLLENLFGVVSHLTLQTTSSAATSASFLPVSSIAKVKSVRICSGAWTHRMAADIEEVLSKTTTLEELSFSGSRRFCHEETPVLPYLARGLAQNTSIQSLDFGDVQAQDGKMAELLSSLRHPKLRKLDLSNNLIGDRTLRALADIVLPNCPSLRLLDLSLQRHRMNMTILGSGLQRSSSLRQLDLSSCQMIDEDVTALVDKLVDPNFSVSDLNLSNNRKVTGTSLVYLAEWLPNITCLQHLNIRKMTDYKSHKVLDAIAEGLSTNVNLLLLQMNYFLYVEKTRKIQYLVNANRGGRRALGECVPLGLWPCILERTNCMTYYCPLEQNAKADAIYTLLRNNPGLWE